MLSTLLIKHRMLRRLAAVLILITISPRVDAITLESLPFRVHITEGGETLGEDTLEILQESLRKFSPRLPAGDQQIDIYVAQTIDEFRSLGAPPGMRRVEGFAKSSEGRIVMKAPALMQPGASYPAVLRHELLHVLLARNTNPANLPRWLNEGIAMMVSGEFRWASAFRVANSYLRGNVIDYNALEFAFAAPGSEEEFGDAYAQSLSMAKFLRDELGEESFWDLIDDLKQRPFDEALHGRLGKTPGQFFDEWRASLWMIAVVSSLVSGFGIFQFAAILAIVAYVRKRRRGKRVLSAWAIEEAEDDGMIFARQLEDQEGPYPWEEDSDDEYRP